MPQSTLLRMRAVTHEPCHHFFGYYDRCPWDESGRYLLAQQTTFMDRCPTPDDELVIGLLDTRGGSTFDPITSTRAWSWQQACQMKWLGAREVIFNDRGDTPSGFQSVILNVFSGARRELPHPQYAVTRDGRHSITLSFSRSHDIRAGYGYPGVPDPWREVAAPDDAGVWRQDLATGQSTLIVSMAQVASVGNIESEPGAKHWLDHLVFNPSGTRFVFLHRWAVPRKGSGAWWKTRLFTASLDGCDLRMLSDHDMVSHFDWRDDAHILAWARRHNRGDGYYLFRDEAGENARDDIEIVGEGVLTVDGHNSYSPDRKWILTDTYPDRDGFKTLLLWDVENQRRIDIGRFYGPSPSDVDTRCDLHPRWNRDGTQVCIDSFHEGTRQMYVLDVGELLTAQS